MTFGKLEQIQKFDPQVLIAGSGPSALGACLTLIDAGIRVLLISGGSNKIESHNQELAQGSKLIPDNHEPLETNRVRASGGTSHLWGGRCVPLDQIDFAQRSWLNLPRWPISELDVSIHYPRAATILGTLFPEPPPEIFGENNSDLIGKLDSSNFESWTKQQNIFAFHKKVLTDSKRVLVLENVHLTGIVLEVDSARVVGAKLSQDNQPDVEISIPLIVLATGAIENSRLLLLTEKVFPQHFAKTANFIGKNYMTHPIISLPHFPLRSNLDLDFQKINQQNVRRRLNLSAEIQSQLLIGNAATFLAREAPNLGSFLGAGKELSNAISKYGKDLPKKIWNYRRQILKTLRSTTNKDEAKVRSGEAEATLHVISEHLPNVQSQITLGDRLDRFGNPLPDATLRFTELDQQTLIKSAKKMAEFLAESPLVYQSIDWSSWEARVAEIFAHPSSHAHMLGGTPMSDSPDNGVTDSWGELHEVSGLFCTGTSLFVTSGQANPTLAAVALAIRTATQVVAKLKI